MRECRSFRMLENQNQMGIDQAVLVAKRHPIKFENVKKWCQGEGGSSQYEDFLNKLKKE
jgi:hypothetical protein